MHLRDHHHAAVGAPRRRHRGRRLPDRSRLPQLQRAGGRAGGGDQLRARGDGGDLWVGVGRLRRGGLRPHPALLRGGRARPRLHQHGHRLHHHLPHRDDLEDGHGRLLVARESLLPVRVELAGLLHRDREHDQLVRRHLEPQVAQGPARRPRSPPPPRHQAQPRLEDRGGVPPLVHPRPHERHGRRPPLVQHVRDAGGADLQGGPLQLL
mmetsp:Transcript_57867/g.135882  ORF Transcript_57867/g.135882 Transcript_57867/m.135882 type:complete len:209 (+) Transcript_57867:866-1492(+)